MKWGPRKPKERMKVVECGTGRWDDHRLDYPHEVVTTNFKITGDGHRRIESIYADCCHDRAARELLDEKQPDHRIGAWLGATPTPRQGLQQPKQVRGSDEPLAENPFLPRASPRRLDNRL